MQTATTITFSEAWPTVNDFKSEYRNSGLNSSLITDANLIKLYYLLYAQFGSSYFIGNNLDQAVYKLYSIIYNKGLIWSKSIDVLTTMLNLTEEDILKNREVINNMADNPGENIMTTGDNYFLNFVRSQNVNIAKDNKATAYLNYLTLLNDFTTDFVNEFKKCFTFVLMTKECDCDYE